MYKSINLWLLMLTIINMAICVSHDNINNNKNITNINVAPAAVETLVATSESIRNLSATMVDVEGNSERIANSLASLPSQSTSVAQNVSNITNPQTTIAYLENDSSSLIVEQTPIVTTTALTNSPVSSTQLELTTEKLSLTNKTLSDSLVNLTNFIGINSSNTNLSKSMKQRGSSNTITKTANSGGIRVTGQKIEMPQLNNLFDHSVYMKKNEHGYRYTGPYFETGNVTNITVQVGNTFYLHCRISLLQDKTVTWIRRNENGLELLTVGKQRYSGDERYEPSFQYPNNWRLKITSAQKIDEATYECQISTSPPRFIHYNVRVNAPTIFIVDEHSIPLLDKYYEVDSTIQLTCIVRHISMMSSVVFWIHNNISILNYDVTRGGISIKTDLMEIGANSSLSVVKVNASDAGNYTCSIGSGETLQQYTVLLHILNESLAELHHSCGLNVIPTSHHYFILLIIALILSSTMNRIISLSTSQTATMIR